MPKIPVLDPRTTRFAASTLTLFAMYWGIYRMPLPGAGEGLDRADAEQLLETAATMKKFHRWDKARVPLERLHAAYPGNHIYMRGLAEVYRELKRFDAEAAMWAKFMDHSPAQEEACPRAAHAWRDAGQIPRMFEVLDRCAAAAPNDADMAFHKAYAQERWGDRGQAEALYTEAMSRFPASADLRLGLARIHLHRGQEDAALAAAKAVLAVAGDNADALLVAGLAAKSRGDREAARRYLERGVQVSPGYADLHLALAEIAADRSDLAGARDHYRRALESDPGNREVKAKLAALGDL